MRRARDLLGTPGIPVKEIAHRIGYASVSAFSTAFKRWHGLAPVEFRANTEATASSAPELTVPKHDAEYLLLR